MSRPTTTLRRAGVLALGATLLVAGPASAHPFFEGGEAPVDSLTTLSLAMAHGCESEAAGEGEPTTDVSLEADDWMRVVDVPEPDGWQVEIEEGDDGVEIVTWTADGGEEAAPVFDLDVVVEGEVGDERFVSVFQACDDFVYRWVGTPDAPADDPAIGVTLVEADPDSPPPPEDEGPEPDEAAEPDDAEQSEPDEPTQPDEPEIDEPDVDEPDAPETDAPDDSAPDDADEDEELATDELGADSDGGSGWIVAVVVVVLLAGIVAWFLMRRGRTAEEG